MPFCLSVIVGDETDIVTWMLENEVIEAEPEEGLIIKQSGKCTPIFTKHY